MTCSVREIEIFAEHLLAYLGRDPDQYVETEYESNYDGSHTNSYSSLNECVLFRDIREFAANYKP